MQFPGLKPLAAPPAGPSFISHQADAANSTSYSFNVTAAAGRVVFFVRIMGGGSVTGFGTITINGSPVTADHVFAAQPNNPVAFLSAVVSAGTVPIVVNVAGSNANRCAVAAWNLGARAFVSAVNSDKVANPADLSINTLAGDVALAAGYDFAATAYTGTNLTERFDGIIEGTTYTAVYDNLNCSGGTPEAFSIQTDDTQPEALIAVYR